jgi:FK506-binding protein 15
MCCFQVCLAKALSTGPIPTSLFTQELVAGDGEALQTGDSVEVKYTGKLLTNSTFGQVFDSNANADKLFRFKLGAGKVIKVKC